MEEEEPKDEPEQVADKKDEKPKSPDDPKPEGLDTKPADTSVQEPQIEVSVVEEKETKPPAIDNGEKAVKKESFPDNKKDDARATILF
jgi:hypothetical protein